MADKRVLRKKIEAEIRRLRNILIYSKCDKEDEAYIKKCIRENEDELRYVK